MALQSLNDRLPKSLADATQGARLAGALPPYAEQQEGYAPVPPVTEIECVTSIGEIGLMSMVAMGSCWQLSTQVLNLMHAFRHEIFVKRLKWSLPLDNGVERDEYDTANAKYVVVSDGSDRVTGCARLLPTTDAYMLPDLFPQLLGGTSVPKDPSVWELSRFAISVRETRDGRVLSLSKPTLEFLDLIFEFARRNDISRLIFVTSITIERLMLRAGMAVHRVAPPALVDGDLSVALFIEITS